MSAVTRPDDFWSLVGWLCSRLLHLIYRRLVSVRWLDAKSVGRSTVMSVVSSVADPAISSAVLLSSFR